MYLHGLLGKT